MIGNSRLEKTGIFDPWKHSRICYAGEPLGGSGVMPKAALNIANATVKAGDVKGALSYLDRLVNDYIRRNDLDGAKKLLDEAQKIYYAANDPYLFSQGLGIMERNIEVGRSAEAELLFESVLEIFRNEARKAGGGGAVAALIYLDNKIRGCIDGNKDEVKKLLDKAQRIYYAANDLGLFSQGLGIVAMNIEVGRSDEAGVLLGSILEKVGTEKDVRRRDNLYLAIAMNFMRIRKMEWAVKFSGNIKDPVTRFAAFREIAGALLANDYTVFAKRVLLDNCVATARAIKFDKDICSYWTKQNQLLAVARKLIEMGEKTDAETILDEIVTGMPKQWSEKGLFDLEKLEDVAICLLKMGKKNKAIYLLIGKWINEEYSSLFTPDQIEDYKRHIIDEICCFKRFAQALKAGGNE